MITVLEEASGTLVRVDGWLAGDGVGELMRVLERLPMPERLVLHQLRGADAAGLSALRILADRGIPLEGLSTYIRLLLAEQEVSATLVSRAVIGSDTPVRGEDT